jgi:K+-sensing histidine kinase KdpD
MDARLAAIIVHDIKNELALLEGELREMTAVPEQERAVHAHGTCIALQDKLIGFLTLYKASSQGLIAQIDAHSPQDFLAALVKRLHFSKAGVTVSVARHDMPHVGFFDEHLVALALEAALQNAMRFAHSMIEIDCRQEAGSLVFSVRDDGDGVGAKEAEEEAPSTGLGMNLCNVIAQAHIKSERKGSATLRNHPESGAIFELRLP